jgi:phage terminase large subunit
VEEAHAVSNRSWSILTPTIRKSGSEIWISFNPELDTDPTWTRFIENTPPDTILIEVNWRDNPWFTDVLEKERQHAEKTLPSDEYQNIWEGKTKAAVSGAIYANEVAAAQKAGRVRNVPYDPMLKVHAVFDLGWNDSMAISLVQRSASEIRLIGYIEDSQRTLDSYSQELKSLPYNWGYIWLPHDGRAKDYKSGKSAEQMMTSLGWDVRIIPNLGIEAGIKAARMTFPRVYFDKAQCERLIHCLKRYRRTINQSTNEPGAPLHDEFSHGADNFRYICVTADRMENDDYDDEPEDNGSGRSPIGGY